MSEAPQIAWLIRRLSGADDRSSFCCGKPSLDDFLRQFATQYDRKDVGRTYVALVAGETSVRGYYTLSTGAMAFTALPEEDCRKLPRHPVPVVHLGRLAVDQSAQGQGLGALLLLDALRRCIRTAEEVGVQAVEVFALDEEARAFYLKYGFRSLLDDGLHLYLPMKAVRKLWGASEEAG